MKDLSKKERQTVILKKEIVSQKRFNYIRYLYVGVILIVSFIYLDATYRKDKNYKQMQQQLKSLQEEKEKLLSQHQDLLLEQQSQSDPEWIELILKRELGVTGPQESKVYFQQEP
jgi:cell division protein FtsL